MNEPRFTARRWIVGLLLVMATVGGAALPASAGGDTSTTVDSTATTEGEPLISPGPETDDTDETDETDVRIVTVTEDTDDRDLRIKGGIVALVLIGAGLVYFFLIRDRSESEE